MKIFILEDDPARILAFRHVLQKHEVTVCQWLSGDKGALADFKPPYDIILLDHDLGGMQMVDSDEEETGAAFARWLCANHPPTESLPVVLIHSYNYVGARHMARTLDDGGYARVQIVPFGPTILKFLEGLPCPD